MYSIPCEFIIQYKPSAAKTIAAGNKVEIPTNVKGNEVLFDVFNNLKGFRTEKMLEALSSSKSIKTVLWQK